MYLYRFAFDAAADGLVTAAAVLVEFGFFGYKAAGFAAEGFVQTVGLSAFADVDVAPAQADAAALAFDAVLADGEVV